MKSNHKNFVHLVGLYANCKMMHGAYNVKSFVSNRNNSTVCTPPPHNDKFTLNPTLIYEVSLELLLKQQKADVCALLNPTHGYCLDNVNKIKLDVIFSGCSALCNH